MGAHHAVDHQQPLCQHRSRARNVPGGVDLCAGVDQGGVEDHFDSEIVGALAPRGALGVESRVVARPVMDINKLKPKWHSRCTGIHVHARACYQTGDA